MSCPLRTLTGERRSPLPGFRASDRWIMGGSHSSRTAFQVKEYLAKYPAVLEEVLLQENISGSFLEKIIAKKHSRSKIITPAPASPEMHFSETGIYELTQHINSCTQDEEIYEKLHEICQVIKLNVKADDVNIYVIGTNGIDISLYRTGNLLHYVGPAGKHLTVSAHVALEKKSLNIRDLPQDSRFPKGIALGDESSHQVMALPILLEHRRCYGVVEFIRGWTGDAFSHREFETTNALFGWISACVQKMKYNKVLLTQTNLNRFLLETTRALFDDVPNTKSIEQLVTKIMIFTKELVSADRCTLFLIDKDKRELFADYFDEGKTSEDGAPVLNKKAQIRFPDDRGIAGYVAQKAEVVNVKDAYKDKRFNKDIDKQTGYKTKNILCMPICGEKGVVGVVQMINRRNGEFFTDDDVEAFKLFAVYLALALNYSRLYSSLSKTQAKQEISQELMEFHIRSFFEDALDLKAKCRIPENKVPEKFYDYDFCAYDFNHLLIQLFIKIIHDTFGTKLFPMDILCRFTLTIRKNYRPVAYHNWEHGFHVAHSVWRMIKTSRDFEFTSLEKMALIIAAICHDIDHRGYNNDFFKKMEHPLAALYPTSTMELHHYYQTVTILNSEGHDIFCFLSEDDRKSVLDYMRKDILATDLALFFGRRTFLQDLIEKSAFNAALPEHREALCALMMTGADLCATSKPWDTMSRTVDYLYDEFWMQGDEEKKKGMKPVPMMDRLEKDNIPNQQIGFINFICKPLYTTLSALLPGTRPLLDGCERAKEIWEEVLREREL